MEVFGEMLAIASAVFETVDEENLAHSFIVYCRRPNIDVELRRLDV
jgi:hypothetical protein